MTGRTWAFLASACAMWAARDGVMVASTDALSLLLGLGGGGSGPRRDHLGLMLDGDQDVQGQLAASTPLTAVIDPPDATPS